MNDELEVMLRGVLGASGSYDQARGESVKMEVAQMYEQKLKLWRNIVWVLLVIDTICIVAAISVFMLSNNVKVLIGSAAVVLLAFESSTLMKLWYWQMNTKFSVLKEVVEIKLQIAQLTERSGQTEG